MRPNRFPMKYIKNFTGGEVTPDVIAPFETKVSESLIDFPEIKETTKLYCECAGECFNIFKVSFSRCYDTRPLGQVRSNAIQRGNIIEY